MFTPIYLTTSGTFRTLKFLLPTVMEECADLVKVVHQMNWVKDAEPNIDPKSMGEYMYVKSLTRSNQ